MYFLDIFDCSTISGIEWMTSTVADSDVNPLCLISWCPASDSPQCGQEALLLRVSDWPEECREVFPSGQWCGGTEMEIADNWWVSHPSNKYVWFYSPVEPLPKGYARYLTEVLSSCHIKTWTYIRTLVFEQLRIKCCCILCRQSGCLLFKLIVVA